MSKKALFIGLLAVTAVLACNAGAKPERTEQQEQVIEAAGGGDDGTSYAIGLYFGTQFQTSGITLDYDEFLKGFIDANEGKDARISLAEAQERIQTAFQAAQTKAAAENKQKGEAFLEENGKKSGITTTASGLQYEVISQGTGAKPAAADTVEVHYEGALLDGTVFDSSYDRGEPLKIPLNRVIQGWSEGVQLMNVGATYRFFISPELGYGEQGNEAIPPNSALIFKVELISIVK